MQGSTSFSNVGMNQVLDTFQPLLQQTATTIQKNINEIYNKAASNPNGVMDPQDLIKIQALTQTYSAVIQAWSSIIKQVGDVERQIAGNIGA